MAGLDSSACMHQVDAKRSRARLHRVGNAHSTAPGHAEMGKLPRKTAEHSTAAGGRQIKSAREANDP